MNTLAYGWALCLKEFRETFRDRRTILTLALMPILVYPLLGIAFQKLLVTQATRGATGEVYRIGCASEAIGQRLEMLLEAGRDTAPVSAIEPAGRTDELKLEISFAEHALEVAALTERLQQHVIDLAISENEGGALEIRRLAGSVAGQAALNEVTDRLHRANTRYLEEQLAQQRRTSPPIARWTQAMVSGAAAGGFYLATLVPLMLILMTVTGAVYPAIDLTAGERERGTLELLAASPAANQDILFAKYASVLAVAMLTALVNLLAMWLTLTGLSLEALVFGNRGLTPVVALQLLLLLTLFAAFFSGVLLAVTSQARSFKEAQAFVIPLMLVAMAPGMLSLLPGLELTPLLATTPLINIVLLSRELLQGTPLPGPLILLAVATTMVYAFGALWLAGKSFGSDAFLAGSSEGWDGLWRRPTAGSGGLSAAEALRWTLGLAPVFVLTSSLPTRLGGPMSGRLAASTALSMALFVLGPWAYTVWRRYSLAETFGLQRPRALDVCAALCLAAGLWALVIEIKLSVVPSTTLDQFRDLYESIRADLQSIPLGVQVVLLGVSPAMVEELFFRGFLQGALRRRWSAFIAIVVAALSFALFHVVVRDALTFERLLPSGLLGLALGLLRERSQSVFPGMLCHACHNSLMLTLAAHEATLQRWGFGMEAGDHLPWWLLLACAVPAAAGFTLVLRRRAGLV